MTHCFLSLQRYSSSSNGEYSTNFMLHFCSTSSERQIFVRQLQLLVTIQIAFVFNTFLSSKIHESTHVYFKVQSSGLMLNGTFMPLCEKAAKLVTTVQICVSTFISMKIHLGTISSCVCGEKTRYFKTRNDLLLNPNQNISKTYN